MSGSALPSWLVGRNRRAPRQRRDVGFSIRRADSGTDRRCAHCGDFIDPIDWCDGCRRNKKPCRQPHKKLRKRADAAFCNAACKSAHRSTFVRDCL